MEYAAWAVYCYIVIQLINDGRQAKSKKQGSEPRGAYYYKIKGLIHATLGLFGTIVVQVNGCHIWGIFTRYSYCTESRAYACYWIPRFVYSWSDLCC